MKIYYLLIIYFVIINIITIAATLLDKYFAVTRRYRISENALISLALLGGCLSEYIVMKVIRHKTKKQKFMVGLPLISVSYIIAAVTGYYLYRHML